MSVRGRNNRWVRARGRVAIILLACAGLVLTQLPARALEVTDITTPVTGNATWFTNLGAPYGGCGLPQDALETQNWIALNVFNTPGDYNQYTRPLTGADTSKIGVWNNGHNCGRWVRVNISDYCAGGVNDGARNQPFCRGGSWTADKYNGATLDMLVADSCGDDNAWCRDDPYHIDLAKDSINTFKQNGVPVGDLEPNHWGNRHVTWNFIPAPNYTGDIQIGFLQGAQKYWSPISVNHLANGIHGVEYYSGGTWTAGQMDTDMGQAFIIKPIVDGTTDYRIRVRDVTDTLINGGREYSFSLPSACGSQCSPARTLTTYTTSGGTTTPPPTTVPPTTVPPTTVPPTTVPPTTVAPTTVPPTTARPTTVPPTTVRPTTAPPTTVPPTTVRPTTAPPTTTTVPSTGCAATLKVTNSWSGGFQGEVTVSAPTTAISKWTVGWTLASGQTLASVWNGTSSVSGSAVTVKNLDYNGSVAAGKTTTFGFLGNGPATVPSSVTCSTT